MASCGNNVESGCGDGRLQALCLHEREMLVVLGPQDQCRTCDLLVEHRQLRQRALIASAHSRAENSFSGLILPRGVQFPRGHALFGKFHRHHRNGQLGGDDRRRIKVLGISSDKLSTKEENL